MADKLESTGLTPKGETYLRRIRDGEPKKSPRGKPYTPISMPRRRDEMEMVSEQDTPDGRRERSTIYYHDEQPVVETIGDATGDRPVAVPGGEHTEMAEALDMMAENREQPAERSERPDLNREFREQMERRAHAGSGRRVFGVPQRTWKGE